MRYAANNPVAAARERFPSRRLSTAHDHLMLVHLVGPPSALHLTHQGNLDVVGLDDRINTGRLDVRYDRDPLLAKSQALADHVWDWWDGSPPPIVYRTRTTPAARSMTFTGHSAWTTVSARRLTDATALLVDLVLRHGFDVPDAWLRE